MELSPVQQRPNAQIFATNTQDRTSIKGDANESGDKKIIDLLSTDTVNLGGQIGIASAQSQRIFLERVLSRTETTTGGAQELFQAAGKADFEARAAQSADDVSPQATSSRILDGITGFIFGAFELNNSDFTEKEFLEFKEQVLEGFETGLQDAKDILTSLQALDTELSESIDETERLVRNGLDAFFESVLEALNQEDNPQVLEQTAP